MAQQGKSELTLAHVQGCPDEGENYCNYCCITVQVKDAEIAHLEGTISYAHRDNGELRQKLDAERAKYATLIALVNEQAEDEGLWFVVQYASEAYLQQELRRLHAAIETLHDYLVP